MFLFHKIWKLLTSLKEKQNLTERPSAVNHNKTAGEADLPAIPPRCSLSKPVVKGQNNAVKMDDHERSKS
jgi:hypothetical protein